MHKHEVELQKLQKRILKKIRKLDNSITEVWVEQKVHPTPEYSVVLWDNDTIKYFNYRIRKRNQILDTLYKLITESKVEE